MERVRLGYGLNLVGQHAGAEQVLRDAWSQAEAMNLAKSAALAKHNLGYSLAALGRFAEAQEVERSALESFRAQGDRRLEAACAMFLARILAWAGDLPEAERSAREAVATCNPRTPLHAYAQAVLASVLLRRGAVDAALAEATAAKHTLDTIGAEGGESLIRLCHAEALHARGDVAAARASIAEAQGALARRAARISDADMRASFLEQVPENRRTMELAAAWTTRDAAVGA
jgi:tetratricopeptide (TPR) repeat protein